MTMMEIYSSQLPEGANISNIEHKRGKYVFKLAYDGMTKTTCVQDTWNPDKAAEYCKLIIKNEIISMYLDAGNVEGAAEANNTL